MLIRFSPNGHATGLKQYFTGAGSTIFTLVASPHGCKETSKFGADSVLGQARGLILCFPHTCCVGYHTSPHSIHNVFSPRV